MKIRSECATCEHWARDSFCTKISCGLPCVFGELPVAYDAPTKASDIQIGGGHYKTMAVQPWDVVDTWPLEQRIGYYRGGALKYVMRMGSKDVSAQEIAKGKHYLEKLLEVLK